MSLRRYFVRRLRRLEPPYLINLAVLLALAVASGGLTTMFDRLPNLAASVFYLHNTIYNEWSAVNFVAWSLEVEAQFYLIAPILAIFYTARGQSTRISLIAGVALFMSVIYVFNLDGPLRYTKSILALGQYFLAGFMIAGLMATGKLRGTRPSAAYDAVALFAFVTAICFDLGWPDPRLHAMGVLPLTIFFLCVFRGRVILAALRWPPVFTIGGMCYTIYLYHFWIIKAPVQAFDINEWAMGPFGILIFDLVMMAFVFAASSVLFAMFERPFMNRPSTSESRG
ncbi:acyltransferase family protein [Roseovarius litorisediminis]|nr:acyltransferase [Roseovarius litorisediminis]